MIQVSLIAHTPNPEQVVAAAAKLCYSDSEIKTLLDDLTPQKTAAFLQKLADLGHSSPTEHASFTFGIEGVSRSLLAQLTRHRIASFSVQSQRYVRLGQGSAAPQSIMPPAIEQDAEAKMIFEQALRSANSAYAGLCQVLEDMHTEELMLQGMDEKTARNKASRMANEDARFVLPNASTTKVILTMNARELNAFFKLRCCNRAQWEIRALADEMLKLVYPIAPHLFALAGPGCIGGACTEGTMTCGRRWQVQKHYRTLKKEAHGYGNL